MFFKEDIECLERLMKSIEDKLGAFDGHITHMQNKLEELKEKKIQFKNAI
ncbi:hypothetical protein [Rummeliibacillus pycnus]|nr:hypothetical protein [Rummeliibacillus pycnus]